MHFLGYGNKEKPIVLMIHGNFTSAKSCYHQILEKLAKDYYLVLPVIEGFDNSDERFISVENTARKIEKYIIKKFPQGVYGICGLSLGGTITACLLERNRLRPKKAFIDAAFGVDLGKKATGYTLLFGILSWLLRPIEAVPFIKKGINFLIPISKIGYFGCDVKNEYRICKSVYHYQVSEHLQACQTEVRFIYGSREKYPAQTAKLMKKYLPHMCISVKKGLGHAGYLMFHPKAYALEVMAFLKKGEKNESYIFYNGFIRRHFMCNR